MRRAIPPLPQYVFMAWCLDKHKDNFTLILSSRIICSLWTGSLFVNFEGILDHNLPSVRLSLSLASMRMENATAGSSD